jgi:molybdopterin/thiamine biosynthesis adenylyltransferase/rhodanese-related sulfurtransferase
MTETLSPADQRRYSRHLKLAEIGAEGQRRLKAARVALIGAGGIGSPAGLYLAAAGVGTLGLVDFDSVDESNLQRQVLFDTASVGASKAEAGRARLEALNPAIRVVAHAIELRAANVREIFEQYDLIIDGSDRLGTRYLVNDACVLYRKPLVSAAIHRFEGQITTYVPDRGPCYRCLFPNPAEGMVPNCADVGVLGVLPGVLGTLAATEAIKLIVGIGTPLIGRLLAYDALEMQFSEFRFTRRADCVVCGAHPTITAPTDPPGFASLDEIRQVRPVTPSQLASALADRNLVLVDVREPAEFAVGHLPQAINVPLGQLESELQRVNPALPRDRTLVFLCRSGARSLRACVSARRLGYANIVQLEGGLLAFKDKVDPLLPI